jgi:sugar (pentulose or hexulose) kinase
MSTVAVLDIGKTNIKLSAVTRRGVVLETVATANNARPGPPYQHPDLGGIEAWLLETLGRWPAATTWARSSRPATARAGVLVDDHGPVMPMVDYEQAPPEAVNAAYFAEAGSNEVRGSPILAGAAHLARQLLWIETEWPEAVQRARWFLGGPQYWAWRLCGGAATELTYLGAQSHLWDIPARRFSDMVERHGWRTLLPPIRPAWKALGGLRPELARRYDLPGDIEVLCGIHDSSANFYRYQQAGLRDLAVISTGTWIVGVTDSFAPDALAASSGMTWNADVDGNPLTGMLAMGGRDFSILAGAGHERPVDPALLARMVEQGTMALPSFSNDDGPFAGSAGKGQVIGPAPTDPGERRALALLYVALLTDACLDLMGSQGTAILDGSFVKDPLYGSLVAALDPGRTTLLSTDGYGTAAGASLLADHETRREPVPVSTQTPRPLHIAGLDNYRKRWRDLARNTQSAGEAGMGTQ